MDPHLAHRLYLIPFCQETMPSIPISSLLTSPPFSTHPFSPPFSPPLLHLSSLLLPLCSLHSPYSQAKMQAKPVQLSNQFS